MIDYKDVLYFPVYILMYGCFMYFIHHSSAQ
jgi:hypothetical protein